MAWCAVIGSYALNNGTPRDTVKMLCNVRVYTLLLTVFYVCLGWSFDNVAMEAVFVDAVFGTVKIRNDRKHQVNPWTDFLSTSAMLNRSHC